MPSAPAPSLETGSNRPVESPTPSDLDRATPPSVPEPQPAATASTEGHRSPWVWVVAGSALLTLVIAIARIATWIAMRDGSQVQEFAIPQPFDARIARRAPTRPRRSGGENGRTGRTGRGGEAESSAAEAPRRRSRLRRRTHRLPTTSGSGSRSRTFIAAKVARSGSWALTLTRRISPTPAFKSFFALLLLARQAR